MEIKMLKRINGKNVFDRLDDEPDDLADAETADDPGAVNAAEIADAPDPDPDADADADAGEDTVGETGETGEIATSSNRKRLIRRIVAVVTGVIFLAALGMSAFFGWQVKQRDDTAAAGRAALSVAQSYAVTLTSVDTNNIDQNFTQVLHGATGEFKDMYSQSASQLRQVLIDNKAMSKGIVVDAAIKSATKTKVEVVLFIDQSISNVANPSPRIDRSRVAMTMELVENNWLASKVDIK